MDFNKHFNLEGRHATLSPSQYHWIRYDDEKMAKTYETSVAARRGTEFHELAHQLVRLRVKLPANSLTLNSFVNHVIGFRMASEQVLYYSDNCFGTADGLGFDAKKMHLRIFDLKTGVSKASFDQLLVYAALFCLEYGFKPFEITYDLRIYQSDEIKAIDLEPADIPVSVAEIMAKIVHFDTLINEWKAAQGS